MVLSGELLNRELLWKGRETGRNIFLCDIVVGFVKAKRTKVVNFFRYLCQISLSLLFCDSSYFMLHVKYTMVKKPLISL